MKQGTLILYMVIIAVAVAFSSVSYAQEDITMVEDSGFTNTERPPVPFVHEDHNEKAGLEECSDCHHVYENGVLSEDETSEDQECSECHGGGIELIKRYHLNCKGCHMERKAGPVTCGECHIDNK